MTKSLQILFGLLLILVLAYVAFLDVSTKIKNNLLTKTKVMFSENNVRDVNVNIQGEGLSLSRGLVLTGTAISDVERVRIVKLTENIEGVCSIDNQIKLHPVVPKAPIVPILPKVPTIIHVPVVKKSTEPIIIKNIPKELPLAKSDEKKSITKDEKKSISKIIIEKKEPVVSVPSTTVKVSVMKASVVPVVETKAVISPVSSSEVAINIPLVPIVENKSIVVPTPVTAISVPKVIEVEKIKLEGVK